MKPKLKESIRKWVWGKSRKYDESTIAKAIASVINYNSNTFDLKLIICLNRMPEYKIKRLKELVNEKLEKG